MESISGNWNDALSAIEFAPEARAKLIKMQLSHLREYSKRAVQSETEWKKITARADEMEATGDAAGAKVQRSRASMAHSERCLAIKCCAQASRSLLGLVCGELVIDESTVGTGLVADERRMVFDVLRGQDL
jgi:hypothetical protein